MLWQGSHDALCVWLGVLEGLGSFDSMAIAREAARHILATRFADAITSNPADEAQKVWNSCWQALTEFATAVCDAMPVGNCCNSLECVNFDKLSEQHLVGGKGCVCAGCDVARYCSKQCQKQHWKQHKTACKRLQGSGAVVSESQPR